MGESATLGIGVAVGAGTEMGAHETASVNIAVASALIHKGVRMREL